MNANQLISIFDLFGWTNVHSSTITSGLINHTWKIDADQGEFILQRINTNIFASPEKIDANIGMIAAYLEKKSPDYLFTIPVTTIDGNRLVEAPNQVFRAFNYIPNTNTISIVETADQAKEAAQTFASFTKALIDFPIDQLHITLPDFHQLDLRYHQFEKAVQSNNTDRINQSKAIIHALENQKNLVNQFNQYIANKAAYKRVMHHDTKISNILFDERGKGLCVIDLDTVMPGFLFSDVGDMFRTYISPVSEEEQNLDKIEVRKDFVEAIYEGYTSELKDAITQFELDHFYLSGEILIYMQSLRFITDYLQNDVYYGKKYPDHNLVRALNQYRLLELFQASTH
jgi:Ser/Thr protein kinase RdoA (MazF antagonist)